MNRALLVGINKYPTQPLNGCVNDVEDMAKFLVINRQFGMNDIRLLVDERATKDSICERLGWLLTGLRAGDRVLFHYSGHGVQLPTRNPQGEVDRLDEAICPVDFDWTERHTIRDKDFNRIFSSIPNGVEFIWISDSCHSGGLTRDLARPLLDKRNSIKTFTAPADIRWRQETARRNGIKASALKQTSGNLNLAFISGCRSDQTSSDAYFGDRANGALTYFLLKQLEGAGLKTPIKDLILKVREALKKEYYDQDPQLEGNEILTARAFLAT